jgi:hypothetical protein
MKSVVKSVQKGTECGIELSELDTPPVGSALECISVSNLFSLSLSLTHSFLVDVL